MWEHLSRDNFFGIKFYCKYIKIRLIDLKLKQPEIFPVKFSMNNKIILLKIAKNIGKFTFNF